MNVGPNGGIVTANAQSPIGAYDWYDAGTCAAQTPPNPMHQDPAGPPTGSHRVVRGCGWNDSPASCRAANRGFGRPEDLGIARAGVRLTR